MTLAYIITEGKTDIEILKRLLPQYLIEDIKFVAGEGQYGVRSLATSLLATRSTPVAIVLDADTENENQIYEKSDLVNYL
jgi:5S rRNA maturation endonuclease (ribonuclease M5)